MDLADQSVEWLVAIHLPKETINLTPHYFVICHLTSFKYL